MTPIDQWKTRGDYLDIGGYNIFVVDENSEAKDTILLVHGFPTSSYDWGSVWETLKAKHRLIAPDMLGFGFSDKPYPHTYSIMEQADIISAVMERSGALTCHILAHDYGDTVVQELMARQNEGRAQFTTNSVCFLNGGLFPETHRALLIQKLLLSPLGPLVNKLTTKARFDKSFSAVFGPETKPTPEDLQAFWDIINMNNGRHIFHTLITYMTDRRNNRERWIDAIRDFNGAVALINGSFDPVSGAHMISRYKELLEPPDFLRELSEIGHYPAVEAPDVTASAYLEFLGSLR